MPRSSIEKRIPLVIAILTLLTLSATFAIFLGQYESDVHSGARSHIAGLLEPRWEAFSRAWDRHLLLLESLRGFAESNLDGAPHEIDERYSRFAAVVHRQVEGGRCLSIAPGGTVAFVFPRPENEMLIGHNFLEDRRPGDRAAVMKALDTGEIALAGPYPQLMGGALTFEAFGAVQGKDGCWGIVSSAIDLSPLLKLSGLEELSRQLALAFRNSDGKVFWGDPSVFQGNPVVKQLGSFGQTLEVGALPREGWRAFVQPKQLTVRAIGILGIFFITGAAYLYARRPAGLVRPAESSENIKTEEALRSSQALLDKAQRLTHSGGWEMSFDGRTLNCSDEIFDIFGVAPREFQPNIPDFFQRVHPEDRAMVLEHHRESLESGTFRSYEYRIVRPDGSVRWVNSTGETNLNDDGVPAQIVGNLQDITHLKQEQEEKEKLESQLIQAQKMESIGRLAGGVAHDFNNMLSVILGCTELIKARAVLDGPSSGYLQEITKAANRSRDITRQLLAFSRKQIIAPKTLKLNDHINEARKILARMIGEDLHLRFQPGNDLWTIKLDPFQLDQILMNLAVNARDAMPEGGTLTMRTANVPIDTTYLEKHYFVIPGEYVLLEITDEGAGMDQETICHLFEPFFTTKKLGQGTGLGLATVYGIVKQNNGFINVYSEPGQGTCFRVYFPRINGEEISPVLEEVHGFEGSETVLLVEDSKEVCDLIAGILEEIGFTVLVAQTPSEALSLCEQDIPIDILVTDVIMPNMNGAELGDKIAAMRPGIKILFMSGYPEDFIANRGILKKGVHFIQKPFSMKDIAGKIRRIIREHPVNHE